MLYFSLHIALLNPLPYSSGLEIVDDLTQFPIHEKIFWRLKELVETSNKDFMLKLELQFQHNQDQIFILQKTAWKLGLYASQFPEAFKVHQFIYIDSDVFKFSETVDANTDLKLCRL